MIIAFLLALISGCSTWSPVEGAYYHGKYGNINSNIGVRFMGVSTLTITDGHSHIMIDGFFSRQSPLGYCKNDMETQKSKVRPQLEKLKLPHLDALFTSHAHFDHILDTPIVLDYFHKRTLIERKTPTKMFGTQASKDYISENWKGQFSDCEKNQSQPCFSKLEDGGTYDVGNFVVTAIETPHVEKKFPVNVFEKIFTCFKRDKNLIKDFPNYSFLITLKTDTQRQTPDDRTTPPKILIIPSANISEDDLDGINADIVFLGIGLLKPKNVEHYWNQTIGKVNASLVVPIHWDNLYRSLDERLVSGPNIFVKTDKVIKELERLAKQSKQTKLSYFNVFDKVTLPRFEQ